MKFFSSLMVKKFSSHLTWKLSWTLFHKWSPLYQWMSTRLNYPLWNMVHGSKLNWNRCIHAHNPPVGGEGTADEVSEMVDDIELGAVVVSSSIIFKQRTLNGPMVPIINTSVSSASPSFVVTGVLKYNINDTITLPSLTKMTKKINPMTGEAVKRWHYIVALPVVPILKATYYKTTKNTFVFRHFTQHYGS